MAQLKLAELAAQGRAYDATRPWEAEELEAVLTLERECELQRTVAADYVRNGITTVAAYEKAQEKEFVPKSLEDLKAEAVAEHNRKVKEELGLEDESAEAPVEETPAEETPAEKPKKSAAKKKSDK